MTGGQSDASFLPVCLLQVFEDLHYYVDAPGGKKKGEKKAKPEKGQVDTAGKLELLKGLTGYAKPGVLTALMGGSGAGKTTL